MKEGTCRLQFRGVRGSIPTPATAIDVEKKLRYALRQASAEDLKDDVSIDRFIQQLPFHVKGCVGGNSACLQLTIDDKNIIFDAGSGCYPLAQEWMGGPFGKGQGRAYWFMTHTHIDHIFGLPMFSPLYIPGNHFTFHFPLPDLRERFCRQQHADFFPVAFEDLGSTIDFVDLGETPVFQLDENIKISWLLNDHPGKSFSYRIDYKDISIVFSTDAEYKDLSPKTLDPVIEFFHGVDLLIFDAQYAFTESVEFKRDWGHSSSFVGIDLALDAEVKRLLLFHHEPRFDDFKLVQIVEQARQYLKNCEPNSQLEIMLAYEGLTFDF